ncbi:MAG: hypothetical protein AB7N54_14245 [Alphaproteobacteria bacterium]
MSEARAIRRRQTVTALRAVVRTELVEFLRTRQFTREKGDNLIYRFRRRGAKQHDLLEIQFDKYRRPTFKINLGVVPTSGIVDQLGRLRMADDVLIWDLPDPAQLCAVPLRLPFMCWFGVGWFSAPTPEQAAERELRRVIRLFSQADRWFRTGRVGLYVSVHTYADLAPNALRRHLEESGRWPPDYWTEEDEEAVRQAEALSGTGKELR